MDTIYCLDTKYIQFHLNYIAVLATYFLSVVY